MKTPRKGKSAHERRLQEACRWFEARQAENELSQAERHDWDRWRTDEDNWAEYEEVALLDAQLRELPPPPLPSAAELRGDSSVPLDDLSSATGMGRILGPIAQSALRRRRARWIVLGACAVLGCPCAIFLVRHIRASEQVYATERGEEYRIVLDDGTVATLTGDTVLRARFPTHPRTAVLERGEVLFQVKHDPKRPFWVRAGNGSIKAIGTEFDVQRMPSGIRVSVTEGVVEVAVPAGSVGSIRIDEDRPGNDDMGNSHPSDGAQSVAASVLPVQVRRGQEVTYGSDGRPSVRQTDPGEILGWRQGLFSYKHKPLREIIEDLQRYLSLSRRITLDPSVPDLLYTGTVRQEDLDDWIHNLPLVFPVEVVDSGSNSILIRSRP